MHKDKKRILITGGAGFVGRHLCDTLKSEHLYLALRHNKTQLQSDTSNIKRCVIGDIADFEGWMQLLKSIDIVIHLAARVHQKNSTDIDAYQRDNVDVVERMAIAASEAGVKRFIFLSSIKVNGELTQGLPFKASDRPAPKDPYAESKVNAEQLLFEVASRSKMEVVVIRPPLIYGPGVKANFKTLWELTESKVLLPFGGVTNRRDMVSIYNLCDLIVRCVDEPKAKNNVFLVSDGKPYSLREIITAMRAVRGRQPGLLNLPVSLLSGVLKLLRRQSISDRLLSNLEVDISETKSALGWRPRVTLEQTLEKMMEV